MKQVVIQKPVINSPFEEPRRHFRFSDEGITDELVEVRRESAYFIPIAAPRKKGKAQLYFETEWTEDRIEANKFINQVRGRVKQWRENNHFGVTRTTAQLLQYWSRPDRERRLFFCQIEALETLIYLTEVAKQQGDTWIDNEIRQVNDDANPKLYRIACKMATGSGKTVVMAMIIAWQTLNKLAHPQDVRFTDTFLVVTPGITIRDRLRVLMPNDAGNYYRQLDIVPPDHLTNGLGKAKIVITNFHAFLLRERTSAGTRPDRCHVSHVVADTDSWEQKLAQTLEDMPEVFAYVKNQNLGFTIPYTLNGVEHNYYPDFIVRIHDGYAGSPSPHDEGVGRGPGRGALDNFLNLILECTGQKKKDKEAKVTTAQTLWIPAVNNHRELGRWEFLEVDDPWDAKNRIKSKLKGMAQVQSKAALDIRRTPAVCGGRACVGNTRIPVWLVVSFIKEHLTDEAILQSYPQLTPDHLRLVRDYYARHVDEIERDIREQDEDEETLRDG